MFVKLCLPLSPLLSLEVVAEPVHYTVEPLNHTYPRLPGAAHRAAFRSGAEKFPTATYESSKIDFEGDTRWPRMAR